MKAVVLREFGPVGSAALEDRPVPQPGPHEVRIDVKAVAANFVDILVMEGRYQFLPERPFVPGKGPTGVVAAVGTGVTRFNPGDRVLAMCEQGGYAEAACASEDQCYALPAAMAFEEAASMSLAADTAWVALMERGRLRPGESVLVTGATGAVGNGAVQIAKAKARPCSPPSRVRPKPLRFGRQAPTMPLIFHARTCATLCASRSTPPITGEAWTSSSMRWAGTPSTPPCVRSLGVAGWW
jgi:NADPH:quinone reductase-like Zn-dependent oxidoreductase